MGDLGSILGLGRSAGEGIGYPLQHSGLENSTDCTVNGVAESRTQPNDFHFTSVFLRNAEVVTETLQTFFFLVCEMKLERANFLGSIFGGLSLTIIQVFCYMLPCITHVRKANYTK